MLKDLFFQNKTITNYKLQLKEIAQIAQRD